METVKEKFLNMIDNKLEQMYQETRYRHMNDLEYGRYCALDEMRTWCDEIFDGVTIVTDTNVSVDERLPEDGTPVAVILTPTYASDYWGYGIARYIDTSNGERHWYEDHHGYLEWDKYSDGRGGCSLYKVTHWMPLPEPPKGVQ